MLVDELLQAAEVGNWAYKGKDDESVIGVELALCDDGCPSTESEDNQAKNRKDDNPCQQGIATSAGCHV